MLKVESVSGIRFDVKSALIVNESVSASPIVILPVKSKSPPMLELPAISSLPNEPVDDIEPLIKVNSLPVMLPLCMENELVMAITLSHGFTVVPICPSEPDLGTKFLVARFSQLSYNDGI